MEFSTPRPGRPVIKMAAWPALYIAQFARTANMRHHARNRRPVRPTAAPQRGPVAPPTVFSLFRGEGPTDGYPNQPDVHKRRFLATAARAAKMLPAHINLARL